MYAAPGVAVVEAAVRFQKARRGAVCSVSIRGQARKARTEKSELDEGFQPHHPPFRLPGVAVIISRLNNNNNNNK